MLHRFHVLQETFYEDRELYSPLLAPVVEVVTTDYQRVVDESEEAMSSSSLVRPTTNGCWWFDSHFLREIVVSKSP